MTWIKVCGVTRPEDAVRACALGVDAVGMIFVERSPRFLRNPGPVRAAITGSTRAVAVFRNASAGYVTEVIAQSQPDILQFHGDETQTFCESFGMPWIRAVSLPLPEPWPFPNADMVLVDHHRPGQGQRVDWAAVPRIAQPLVLAGGLTPANVAEAIATVSPAGVDVASGVESAPGVKDHRLLDAFIHEVQRAQPSG